MKATFQLMQREGGMVGKIHTEEVESIQHAKERAVAWSMGELGHPWDCVVVTIPEADYQAEISL